MLLLVGELAAQPRTVKDLFESPVQPAAEAKSATTAASSQPAVSVYTSLRSIAEVNNQKIDAEEFSRVILASAGPRVLRQFIGLTLAKQMARSEGIDPTEDDFARERREIIDQISPEKDATGKPLKLDDKERLLKAILLRRGLSNEEFEIGLQNQVYLKAIVKKKIEITDKMLKEEFGRVYGPKRKIRGIMVVDLNLATEIYNKLQKGEDFATLANKYSIDFVSSPIGGQLGDITKSDPRFAMIVSETAYKVGVGKFSSPIRVKKQYWIIKVDAELPAEPISFDKVRDKLYAELYNRLEADMIQKLETELFKTAKIKVYDSVLSDDFKQWREQYENSDKQ
jgi:foldase protein PrsA